MSSNDPLKNTHAKEFAELRRSRWSGFRAFGLVGLVLLTLLLLIASVHKDEGEWLEYHELRASVASSGTPWVSAYLRSQEYYDEWLARRALPIERRIFNEIAATLLESATAIARSSFAPYMGTYESFLGRALVSAHVSGMRVTFAVIACWRFWVVVILGGWLWGRRKISVHHGSDLLGLTGNNRAFFSGSRIDLHETSPAGAPLLHVTGLACPTRVSRNEARNASLGKTLERLGVLNDVTLDLAAIIVRNSEIPAYLAHPDEEAMLRQSFEGARLLENAERMLERVLALHTSYTLHHDAADDSPARRAPEVLADSAHLAAVSGKVRGEDYPKILQRALHRVLRPALQREMGQLRPTVVAATVLAMEAGKVLAYRKESEHWIKRSSFPQLSARAVLHSLETFGREFDLEERTIMRRALVYASRHSVFSSVRFPVDMSPATRALRQWTEILLAAPHALHAVADETELFGIVCELQAGWSQRFIEGVATSTAEIVEGCYVAQGNLVFVPVDRVVRMIRSLADGATLQRLEELVFLVNQRQRVQAMANELAAEGELRTTLASHERIFAPLSHDQVAALSQMHGLSESTVREWSSMRVVLSSFGWLGRRVGDYTVPESSIIFSVFKFDTPAHGANQLGLVGTKGMVALRATRLEARMNRVWRLRFTEAAFATMAETPDIYEKLLKGVVSEPIEESSIAAGG